MEGARAGEKGDDGNAADGGDDGGASGATAKATPKPEAKNKSAPARVARPSSRPPSCLAVSALLGLLGRSARASRNDIMAACCESLS